MDITEIFNIDFIKTINIEQRNIDLSDNIINPDNEEENEQNEDEPDVDDKEVIIKKLVSENELF